MASVSRLYRWKPVNNIVAFSKKAILPGAEGATMHEVATFFVREIKNVRFIEKAAAVTYNFLMAIPPTFLILLSIIPYLPLHGIQNMILIGLKDIIQNEYIYKMVRNVVIDFMNTQRKDFLSYGILLVLFFSSNGIMGLMRSFDHGMALYKKRSSLKRRWTAIKLTVILIFVTIILLSILVIQNEKLNIELRILGSAFLVRLLSFFLLIIIIFLAISIVYTYGPSLTRRFRFISAGSVFATILCVITTEVFFYLVNHILLYNKIYGSIGTLTVFMVWVWLNVLVILVGYELNLSLMLGKLSHRARNIKKLK